MRNPLRRRQEPNIPDIMTPFPMDQGLDPSKAEIVANLMKKENIGMVSDIDNYELAQLSALKVMSKLGKTDDHTEGEPVTRGITKSILTYRVSHERKGREEIVEITKNEKPESLDKKRRWWNPF